MPSAPAIAFDYRPSRRLAVATGAIASCAALAPWLSAAPVFARAGFSLAALALAGEALWRLWHPPFRRIAHGAAGWMLVDGDGREHAALLEAHARLGTLLVLGLRSGPSQRWRAWLLPDNLDADTRRRLILQLARGEPAATSGTSMR
jgi:membrane-bound toxin of toxin-antitoxin system